jgi:hypothetical protein
MSAVTWFRGQADFLPPFDLDYSAFVNHDFDRPEPDALEGCGDPRHGGGGCGDRALNARVGHWDLIGH